MCRDIPAFRSDTTVDPALSCQFLCFFRAFYCGCCPKGAARFHAGKMAGCHNRGQRICSCHVEVQNSSKRHCHNIRDFSLFPNDQSAIKTAMKMRGIEFSFKNIVTRPSETIVHILVPLFISALNISDELAAAALCRGLDNPGAHTCMTQIRFRWYDIAFLLVVTFALVVICVLNIRGYSL